MSRILISLPDLEDFEQKLHALCKQHGITDMVMLIDHRRSRTAVLEFSIGRQGPFYKYFADRTKEIVKEMTPPKTDIHG